MHTRFVGIVQALELQLAAMDAASLVGFVKRRLDAQAHLLAQSLRWPGEGGGLAEQDLGVGNPRDCFICMPLRCGRMCGRCSRAVLLRGFVLSVPTC